MHVFQRYFLAIFSSESRFFFFFFFFPQLPWEKRAWFNAAPPCLASSHSFILDTTTIRTFMPSMDHGDWEAFGKLFYNYHKKQFGVKAELAVAMQRRPVPLFCSVAPAGMNDLTIARRPGDVFSRLKPGEVGLGDPGYIGQSDKIYAPPKKNMNAYVKEDDKAELTLQRRVEMANKILKRFKVLGTTFRKGAVRAYGELSVIISVVSKLVFWDLFLNQEHGGLLHTAPPQPIDASPQKERSVFGLTKRSNKSSTQSRALSTNRGPGKRRRIVRRTRVPLGRRVVFRKN